MSNWDNLSMREKAAYIKVGVLNGLTSISDIKEYYDKFREVNASAGNLVNAIQENTKSEIYLGKPSHNYDFTQSEEWANLHGYYPDSRGHRDDRVKKPAHPTHPSRGTFRSMNEFELSDIGMQDPNYTLYGLNDGGQDPQAIMTYKGGIVLPEITITPKGNYVYNSYDNITNKLGGGSWLNSQESGKTVNEKNKATDIGYTPFSYNNKMIYGDIETIDEGLIPFFYENQVLYRNNNDNTYYADNKGTIPVKDKDNNMLYAYYNLHIKNLSNRDIIKFYTNRYRNTQNKWMAASKPLEYNTRSPKIEVTKGKSSGVLVPTAMIDSIVSHTKAHNYTVNKEAGLVDDPYTALAVASVETDFGKHLNHGSLVNQSGLTPAVFNDERYYLPDQSYYAGLSTALRNYYNELSKTQKMEDKQENFVKHYLDLKNLFNDPKAVEYVGNALKKDLIYRRFKNYTMQDLLPPPNVYDHILKEIYSGKYNSGNANYNSNVRKNAEILRSDPNVRRYVQKAVKKYDIGGPTDDPTINNFGGDGFTLHTGNNIVDTGLAFVPFYGTAMDIENAIKDPTLGNIGMAALGLLTDLTGLTLAKGLAKSVKLASKATKAADKYKDATTAYQKALHNQTKYGSSNKRVNTTRKTFKEMKDAEYEFLQTHKKTNRRTASDRSRKIRYEATESLEDLVPVYTGLETGSILGNLIQ